MSQDLLLAGEVWARDSCDGDLYRKLLHSLCGEGAGGCHSSHKSTGGGRYLRLGGH